MSTQDAERRKHLRNLLLAALLLVLLALLVKGALVGRHVYALWRHGTQLRGLARNPGALLNEGAPAQIKALLAGIEQALRGLRAELQPVLRPLWLPWRAARENLLAADELLRVGTELTQAGQVASTGLEPIVSAMTAPPTSEEAQETQEMSKALFAGLVDARPYFDEAAQQVDPLCGDIAALALGNLWAPLDTVMPTLEYYLRLGHAALQAAAAAPTLLGETHPTTYMILIQNSDELRPTGGFITGIGLVTVEQGKISQLSIMDSYDVDNFTVDHPYAPEPMQRYMNIFLWVTRDGNWSPDFPTAAQAVKDLYHLENSTPISGMLALDMYALQALLEAVGPVQVWRYKESIDGDNVLEKLREHWAPELPERLSDSPEWRKRRWLRAHRKDFMTTLGRKLMKKIQAQSQPARLVKLLRALRQAMDEKHILLYFHEPAAQELLAAGGWDGTVGRNPGGDYLLALDTNMGYNKVNLNVEKSIEYDVTLGNDTAPLAALTITYHNHSPAQATCEHTTGITRTYEQRAQGCYWNYLRVYVPPGSQLLAVEGITETETLTNQHGKTVFASFMVVAGGETRVVRFKYRLPYGFEDEYSLLVQKQAGTDAVPLAVQIALPPGVRASSVDPKPQNEVRGLLSYDLDLRQDRSLLIEFR